MADAKPRVTVIGGGLAGSECAWQLVRRGIPVTLREMKPHKRSPAHKSDQFAELVCSNSLRSDNPESAIGLLHAELRALGSLVLRSADTHRVPAGDALAVEREKFSGEITQTVREHPLVEVVNGEVEHLPEGSVVDHTKVRNDLKVTVDAPMGGKAVTEPHPRRHEPETSQGEKANGNKTTDSGRNEHASHRKRSSLGQARPVPPPAARREQQYAPQDRPQARPVRRRVTAGRQAASTS